MLTPEGPPRVPWPGREQGLQDRGPGRALFPSVGVLFLAVSEGRVSERCLEQKCFLLLDASISIVQREVQVFLC